MCSWAVSRGAMYWVVLRCAHSLMRVPDGNMTANKVLPTRMLAPVRRYDLRSYNTTSVLGCVANAPIPASAAASAR